MTIEWKPSLAVGVEEIDQQHRELFVRVNQFLSCCREGKSREEIVEMMAFLGDYVVTHFEAEERYMERNNYPRYAQHKTQHLHFRRDLEQLRRSLDEDPSALSLILAVNQKVVNWLIKHVSGSDKEFGEFLKTGRI
jgi:hemerythrin